MHYRIYAPLLASVKRAYRLRRRAIGRDRHEAPAPDYPPPHCVLERGFRSEADWYRLKVSVSAVLERGRTRCIPTFAENWQYTLGPGA